MKTLKIILISVFLGLITGSGLTIWLKPAIKTKIEIQKDIIPVTHTIIKYPETTDDYLKAFNSPIDINRYLIGEDIYDITASDGWKSTHVQDRIKASSTMPRYLIQGAYGFTLINKKITQVYGLTFSKFFNDRFTIGVQGTYGSKSISASISGGFLIY